MSEKLVVPASYMADLEWALEHIRQLHARYENQWVAVVDGRVVAADADPGTAQARAARQTGRQPDSIYMQYVEDGAAVYGPWQG
jgi:DUF1009 family protein